MTQVVRHSVDEIDNKLLQFYISYLWIWVYGQYLTALSEVGKTYLIRNFFQTKKCLYFQSVGLRDGSLDDQLENFTDSFSETFYDDMAMQKASSWKEAFQRLTTVIKKQDVRQKIVLFFDELPWMVTARSGLLESLDYFWNQYWVNCKNLKLIICGSSASWILKKIIYSKWGLHNRVTRQIILKPFSLEEVKCYLAYIGCAFNHKQVLSIYMAIGGIPFYLNAIKKHLSVSQNINNLCFRKSGLLFNEFDKLFRSLFYEADAYMELVRLVAQRRYGISRLDIESKAKLSQKGGSLTDRLKDLEEAGFILSFVPLGNKHRGLYYKIIDEFSLFYLTWIEPEKEILIKVESKSNFWSLKNKTSSWNSWAGYSFESICYKHLSIIRKVLDIPDGSRSGGWRLVCKKGSMQKGAQIDLLFDRDDGNITICEIKHRELPYCLDKVSAENLINKGNVYKKSTRSDKNIVYALIVSSGLKASMYSEELLSGVVTLDDFFN